MADEEYLVEETQLIMEQVNERKLNLSVGDTYEEKIENIEFGRIAAQTAKQVIVQKVRDAEREIVIEEYQGRVGELIAGVVKKVTRDSIIVDLGGNQRMISIRSFDSSLDTT